MMLVAGFIGLNCALSSLVDVGVALVNQDKLIYACSVLDLKRVERNLRNHSCDDHDRDLVRERLSTHRPRTFVHNGLAGNMLPIYGDEPQRRDWPCVTEHSSAVWRG